jgi:hypothetical protein
MTLALQRQYLLEKARLSLLRLNPPSYGFADAALREVYVALQVISVIAKVHPRNYRKRVAKLLKEFFKDIRTPRMRQTDNQGNYNSTLIARLINDNLFHVDEFWLDEECMDFGTDNTVQIEWMGYRISWDEYDEMLGRLDELTRAGSFTVMMGILWGNVETASVQEVWGFCNEIYKWNLPEMPDIPDNCYIDISQLRRRLGKHGIQSLATLVEAFDGSTGNVFYDYDPETWMPITISEKDLITAHEDWLKVPKIRKQLDDAYDILETRSEVFTLFLDAYITSLRSRQRNNKDYHG